jgi:hypothetical protein
MPVSMPIACSMATTSSVARLPDAPGAYGQPPRPPTAASMVSMPSDSPATQLASAAPRVSWKCIAICSCGTSASTISSTRSTCIGLATPMVSPSDTW